MFKENRFILKSPGGLECSSPDKASVALRERYARLTSLEERKDLSMEILVGPEEKNACTESYKEIAREELVKYAQAKLKAFDDRWKSLFVGEDFNELWFIYKEDRKTAVPQEVKDILRLENFETLSVDERAMIEEAEKWQEVAVGRYSGADVADDLKLNGADTERIKSASVRRAYEENGGDYLWEDEAFYGRHLYTYNDGHSSEDERRNAPGHPRQRIYTRQMALSFMRERGDMLEPCLKARIYVDIAHSLTHGKIKEKNRSLALKFLDKAIAILEAEKASHPYKMVGLVAHWKMDTGVSAYASGGQTLFYAYSLVRRIKQEWQIERKQTQKPNPDVVAMYEKMMGASKELYSWDRSAAMTEYLQYLDMFGVAPAEMLDLVKKHFPDYKEWHDFFMPGDELAVIPPEFIARKLANEVKKANNYGVLLGTMMTWRDMKRRWPAQPAPHSGYFLEWESGGNVYPGACMLENYDLLIDFFPPAPDDPAEHARWVIKERLKDYGFDDEMVDLYRDSPVVGADYRGLAEASSDDYNGALSDLEKRVAFFRRTLRNPVAIKIFKARLLDDWAPKGKVDRPRALELYKEALKSPKIWSMKRELLDVIARCYRIVNGPDMYGVTNYGFDTVVGAPLEQDASGEWQIEDPADNIEILYLAEDGRGIAMNRYVNATVGAYISEDNYREKMQELRGEKDAKKRAELKAEIEKLRAKVAPEAVGSIFYFKLDQEGRMMIHPEFVFDGSKKSFPLQGVTAKSLEISGLKFYTRRRRGDDEHSEFIDLSEDGFRYVKGTDGEYVQLIGGHL